MNDKQEGGQKWVLTRALPESQNDGLMEANHHLTSRGSPSVTIKATTQMYLSQCI